MLIIFGGLPGSGKTMTAQALAKRLKAMYVRVDTIEHALRNSDVLKADEGPAGYMIAYGVAEDNLKLGQTVVADSVNSIRITRDAWLSVAKRAGAQAVEVEVVCSDRAEHRRRAETRMTDIEGLVKPTWDKTVNRHYENWGTRPIVVDTAHKAVDDLIAELMVRLGHSQD
ncbi:AAA family ATPase [Rhizobium rhizogenes]|uniref:AAA family ATPase n=1 Tax=Rhizobium rhizogenes TaxID=359 RepID=UPI001574871A|nr:AAA family ATPase [Rhizobium rhizogenes]NTF82463.1 AAA family ATPase [Rhizobium rhizogenes]